MAEKPKIQYVGQFYIHGSEAPKLEPKKAPKKVKNHLPMERLQKIEKVYLDPTAMAAIVVSLVMLVTMAVGVLQLKKDWEEYQVACDYAAYMNRSNALLEWKYERSFDKDEIRSKALALGMIPAEEAAVKTVIVTPPEPEPRENPVKAWVEHVQWFWEGLWA